MRADGTDEWISLPTERSQVRDDRSMSAGAPGLGCATLNPVGSLSWLRWPIIRGVLRVVHLVCRLQMEAGRYHTMSKGLDNSLIVLR